MDDRNIQTNKTKKQQKKKNDRDTLDNRATGLQRHWTTEPLGYRDTLDDRDTGLQDTLDDRDTGRQRHLTTETLQWTTEITHKTTESRWMTETH